MVLEKVQLIGLLLILRKAHRFLPDHFNKVFLPARLSPHFEGFEYLRKQQPAVCAVLLGAMECAAWKFEMAHQGPKPVVHQPVSVYFLIQR